MHYIESLYAQFDVDRNWELFRPQKFARRILDFKAFATDFALKTAKDKLDLFATLSAVPLAGYSCYSQNDLIRESFIYLVYHGRTPGND